MTRRDPNGHRSSLTVSRRLLLGSALAFLGAAAPAAPAGATIKRVLRGRSSGGGGGSIPLVGPHASWDPATGEGGTVPADPTRTTAKPMASWWTPTLQRFTDDFIVGVIADAKGGVASVEFMGGCANQVVTAPSVRPYVDANNVTRKTPIGYWIALDHSQFVAVNGTTSKLNLYAKVTAVDGSMQFRVIGGTNVDGVDGVSGNLVEGKIPQQHYPRSLIAGSAYDWEKTVGVGGHYTTWAAMVTALKAAAPKSPHVTFITTATYDMAGLSDPNDQWAGTEGYCVVDAADGITATLVRGLAFNPVSTSSPSYWNRPWYLLPGCNQYKFTGSGIVFDVKNFTNLIQTNNYQPFWFDGCKFTNSIGTLDATYFNGGDHPGFYVYKGESNPAPCYVTECEWSYVSPPRPSFIWRENKARFPKEGVHNEIRLNIGNYERGATPEFQYYGPDKMSGTYVGAATTATCKIYGYDTGCKVELIENGGVVKTVFFPNLKNSRSYLTAAGAGTTVDPEIAAVVAELNTRSGWTFTELNASKTWFAWAFNNGVTVELNCKSVTATWKCGIDKHTEFLQQFSGGVGDENYIIWNNVIRDAFYTSCYFNDDTAQDASIKFNVFDVTPGGLDSAGNSQWGLGKHLLIENNFLHDGIREAHAAGKDAYSSFRQNITTAGPEQNSSGVWPATPGYQDNFWVVSAAGQAAGALDDNLTPAANAAAIYLAFTDRANGDYRPAAGGVLTLNKRARRGTYDGRGNALASTDSIGPWADGYGAPSWPF